MADIIPIFLLILGIFAIRFAKKKSKKYIKVSGIILIVLFLFSTMPSFLSGVYKGFSETSRTLRANE